MDFVYKFPVVKGIQARREYYIGMVPLKAISRIFIADDEYVLPEYRAQRRLNTSRIPAITKYILTNRNDYVFSALAASIDGKFKFIESEKNSDLGVLEISMDARILINDGQHRKAAILEALTEDDTLGDETISVVFYKDIGLERSQQIFTDLNKHAVKTSNSIAELYDSRDDLAVITRRAISEVPFINKYTDKEKDNLGKYSSKLFTLNTFYQANKRIVLKEAMDKRTEMFLEHFWNSVADNMVQWQELEQKEISKIDLRENYIITQAVVIRALGSVGHYFFTHPEVDMREIMPRLQYVDWRRSACQWQMRTIRENGRMISSNSAVILIGNVIKQTLKIELDTDEAMREKRFLSSHQ